MTTGEAYYKTVLLKLSGEALRGPNKTVSLDLEAFVPIAESIERCLDLGASMAIVVGGGNFIRGRNLRGETLSSTRADQLGMLATVMNALALEDFWQKRGIPTMAMSAIQAGFLIDLYEPGRARKAMDSGRLLILAGGTGNTHFTTDTAAVLRGVELGAEVLLKATKVDGIFSDDPETNPDAVQFSNLTYQEAMEKKLKIMDQTAFALCLDHNLPIVVFSMIQPENMVKAVQGRTVGTLVTKGAETE